jgi:hypothetical protein
MLKAIDINKRIEWSSKLDETEPKTIFVLKPQSGFDMLEFATGSKEEILALALNTIVEVKNFPGIESLTIKDVIMSLEINVLGELLQAINSLNRITGQDAKN